MNLTYRDFNASEIGVDIETKDPLLKEKGNGVYRKDGYILGVSFSDGERSEYYPINHKDTDGETKFKNEKFIIEQLKKPNAKVFANAMYDLDWMENYQGWKVEGEIHDIQLCEPLLDEYSISYSLNNLSDKYLNKQKLDEGLIEYCEKMEWKGSTNSHLWKMTEEIVSPYASEDSYLTLKIFEKQKPLLMNQDLWDIYELEKGLLPLLLQMRRTGVLIDIKKLNKTGIALTDVQYDLQQELNEIAGFELNCRSSKQLETLFNKLDLFVHYGEPTELMRQKGIKIGNPRFDKNVLTKYTHPVATKILELRHVKTLLEFFIHPYPELVVDARLHCNFNQLKSDQYGTVSGRFSSSNPNLQQVSGQTEEYDYEGYEGELLNGKVIRKLFIPEEGCKWLKFDWSQIEYRLIAHYAMGDGSETIRDRYNTDPDTDYHDELGKMAGIEDRKIVKTLNFGAAYGMGINKMSNTYGWDLDEAKEIYYRYHDKVPFVKETSNKVAAKAKRIGFIRTILGRRARLKSSSKAYVMFNRLIQGGAADLMKKAMKDAYEAGIYNVLKPHLTVHDELDQSMPDTKEGYEAAMELKNIMENCVKLRVPIKADMEIGNNWGELEEVS